MLVGADDVNYRKEFAVDGQNLGWKALLWAAQKAQSEDPAAAETLYRRALAASEVTYGKAHPNIAVCALRLAEFLESRGLTAESASIYRRAAEIVGAIVPEEEEP